MSDRGPTAADIKSSVRNTLLANPLFPKFYADTVIASRPNSKLANVLRHVYPKILDKVKSNMAIQTCTHIKVSGVRCGSPALRGEQFCYFHQRMHRGVRTPPQARLHPIANLEDEESIQAALMEVVNALMRNTIDLKRANLILRALHIAVKNANRVHYKIQGTASVRDIPDYAEPDIPRHAAPPSDLEPPFEAALEQDSRVRSTRAHTVSKPHESREDMIAHYYGYPNAQAHAQAKAAAAAKAATVAHPQTANDQRPTANDRVPKTEDQQAKSTDSTLAKRKPPENVRPQLSLQRTANDQGRTKRGSASAR